VYYKSTLLIEKCMHFYVHIALHAFVFLCVFLLFSCAAAWRNKDALGL